MLGRRGGMSTGFFYPFYLWTVFGNGFRFGVPYLYAAMVMANAGFLAVLHKAGAWHQYPGLSIALFACLIMLPLYAAKLIRKLSEAKRQAEEANRAKSAFLASVSHEVRTPLNAIIGLGDLLCDQLRNQEHRHMVSTIVSSGRSLLRLINSILDFSRIEAGRMPSKVVQTDLYHALGQLKAMLAAQVKSQALTLGVHITARTPPLILADYCHIEQILINLAANAIKFTEKGYVVVQSTPFSNKESAYGCDLMSVTPGSVFLPRRKTESSKVSSKLTPLLLTDMAELAGNWPIRQKVA
jgi:two-component system sensor histidine kinase RpfC